MSGFARLLPLLGSIAVLAPPVVANAQQPGATAPMPLAVDLAKVPLGAYADYTMSVGALPPMKTRMALVGKAPSGTTLEMSVEGGMMAMAGGKMVVQTIIDPAAGKAAPIKKLIMQLGANDPMEMPPEAAQRSQFKKPDPKTLINQETVTVPAGTFKAKHYRDKSPEGDSFDYWISDRALPLGLVKMEGEQKRTPGAPGPVKLELTALGKDAKSGITKPAKPYDEARFKQQVMGGAGGPPAAPSAAPVAPAAKK